jgi:hypothetical protein
LKADVYLWTGKRQGGGDSDIQTALAAAQTVSSRQTFHCLKIMNKSLISTIKRIPKFFLQLITDGMNPEPITAVKFISGVIRFREPPTMKPVSVLVKAAV